LKTAFLGVGHHWNYYDNFDFFHELDVLEKLIY